MPTTEKIAIDPRSKTSGDTFGFARGQTKTIRHSKKGSRTRTPKHDVSGRENKTGNHSLKKIRQKRIVKQKAAQQICKHYRVRYASKTGRQTTHSPSSKTSLCTERAWAFGCGSEVSTAAALRRPCASCSKSRREGGGEGVVRWGGVREEGRGGATF